MPNDDERFRYATTDPKLIAAFREWGAKRRAMAEKADEIAKRYGREPVIYLGLTGDTFDAFRRSKGESADAAAWKGTPWTLTSHGYLRPRLATKEGKRLAEEMHALRLPHPGDSLVGIPKTYGLFSRPGMELSEDEKTLIVTYTEKMKHDKRWTQLKESTYWQMREAKEAAANG